MSTVTVTGYKEANQTLALADLKQSLYDEGRIMFDRVLVTLDGEDHRKRRLLEMKIFKKDFFNYYEKEVLPKVVQRTLAKFLPTGRADLMDFGRRSMLDLTADFAGIDRPNNSDAERDELVGIIHGLGAAATLGQYSGDREPVREMIRRTLRQFDERFFTPSAARRQALIDRFRKGEIAESELPRDILTVLLRNEDNIDLPRDMILRETAFYYLAGAHTSVHSLTHAMHEMFTWIAKHPEDAAKLKSDPLFVQRCVHESLRLHPSSPVAKRKPTCPVHLPTGDDVQGDDEVVIDLYNANRQVATFGADAADFNPYRQLPGVLPPYGITFGVGIHTCLGRNLAAGDLPKANTDPASHQYGTITLIARALIAANVRPDPASAPTREANVVRSFIAAWNANDLESVVAHLHPDVVYHNVPVEPIHGREAVRAYLFGKGGFDWVDWKLLAIAETGHKVLTERIDDFGIGGRDVSLPLMGIFEIEDGLIRAWRDYFDLRMYRRQLEQPPRREPSRS